MPKHDVANSKSDFARAKNPNFLASSGLGFRWENDISASLRFESIVLSSDFLTSLNSIS